LQAYVCNITGRILEENMKKGIFIVMILALALQGVFAGGGKAPGGTASGGAAKGPVEITFRTWNPGSGEARDHLVAAWSKFNPNSTVEFQDVAYSDHIQSLKVLVASGEGPDLYGIQVGSFIKEFSEFTVDVAPGMAKDFGPDWENKFARWALEQTKGDLPTYYGLPTGASYAGFYWANLSYFDKYNLKIPASYNELLAVTKTLRSKGELPLLIGAKDDWINIDTFMNMACDIDREKVYAAIAGKVPFTDPVFVQALTIWKNCFDQGIFQDGALGINVYSDATTIFEDDHKAPMICNGAWTCSDLVKMGTDGTNFEVFTLDWNNDGKQSTVMPGVDVVLSISKESKHPQEAWEFFKWYILEGVKYMIDEKLQYFPVINGYEANLSTFPALTQRNAKKVIAIAEKQAYGYREMAYPRLKQTIADQLKAVALGESTPQRAAQIIEAASKAEKR
jgi:ABC-type glycerol-3-phosphate transport system substrate-binding protein